MKLYNNQKHFVFINAPKNKENPYSIYNNDAITKAQTTLSHSAFRMYIYFGTFKEMSDGLNLSMKDATAKTGLSERSYRNAIKELEEAGYIEPQPNGIYLFIEKP